MKKRKLLRRIKRLERVIIDLQLRVTALEARPWWGYLQPPYEITSGGAVSVYPGDSTAAPNIPPLVTIC